MTYINTNYDNTLKANFASVQSQLTGAEIIYLSQSIENDETQIDGDGPWTTYYIYLSCIEKKGDEFIFHTFMSNMLQGIYGRIGITTFPSKCSITLTQLINNLTTLTSQPSNSIDNFIQAWNKYYFQAMASKNDDLISKMNSMANIISKMEELVDSKAKEEKEAYDKAHQEYLDSDKYKLMLKEEEEYKIRQKNEEQQKEQERLQRCIEAYGPIEGPKFWRCL
jgi:hypothetical protein